MQAIIQRVSDAQLEIEEQQHSGIGRGIVALAGVEKDDNEVSAKRMAERIVGCRIFADADMQISLTNNGPVIFILNS